MAISCRALGASILAALTLSTPALSGEIEFFQTKPEALATFDKLISQFEAENPDIKVKQISMPDPGTVLRTRMVRGALPDVIAIGGDRSYADLADGGALKDLSGGPLAEKVQPFYRDMVKKLTHVEGEYGVPYTANANSVLYNKDIFAENGWKVPQTWDEFVALAKAAKDKGITPLYNTYLDSWCIMVPFNSLAGNLQSADFAEARTAGTTKFSEQYREVAEKLKVILDFGHSDNFGIGYDAGNAAFAAGKSAMLMQGVWAVPPILAANPDARVGAFTLPVSNEPGKSKLVSGVDTLFAISKTTKNPEDADKLVAFLQRPDVAKAFIDEQKQFSALKGVVQDDPLFEYLKVNVETGNIGSFPDHYFPAGMNISSMAQEFLMNGDVDTFLNNLDTEWDSVAQR